MTGLELLWDELKKRGINYSASRNNAISAVLDIVANADGKYSEMDDILRDLRGLKRQVSELEGEISRLERERLSLYEQVINLRNNKSKIIDSLNEVADAKYKETKEYIDRFFKALDECESPEKRDAVKAAQTYVNSVTIKTGWDNQAFIIGLASILSADKVNPIGELAKVNKSIARVYYDERLLLREDPPMTVIK